MVRQWDNLDMALLNVFFFVSSCFPGSRPVHFNDFFEKNLIHNLASLLQIDESRIRIVEVVNALESSRRRRRKSNDGTMNIKIEIGNPPQPQIPYTPEGKFNPGNSRCVQFFWAIW